MRKSSIFFILLFASIGMTSITNAAPESKLIQFWDAHDPESKMSVSHSEWQRILERYLDANHASGVNRFDYAAVSKEDRLRLEGYLVATQAIDPRQLNRSEQLAYWINLYNALTVKVVLDDYPVESITKIRFLTSFFGPWNKDFLTINGKALSLNDIEHGILRPIWNDPLIHFAVNCASIGCPNLLPQVFTADNAEELMENAAQTFIAHDRGVQLSGDTLILSSIFDWYGIDFGNDESEVIEFIADYLDADFSTKLNSVKKVEYQYNWQLNMPK